MASPRSASQGTEPRNPVDDLAATVELVGIVGVRTPLRRYEISYA
jgi:hypothetical protein